MVLRLIRLGGIQWWCLFLKHLFFGNLFQKIRTVCWSWNLELWLIQICRIWCWFLFFYFLDWKYSFRVQKFQIVTLSWNLVTRLFWISNIWSKLSKISKTFLQVLSSSLLAETWKLEWKYHIYTLYIYIWYIIYIYTYIHIYIYIYKYK